MKFKARYVMEVESIFEFEADSIEEAKKITQDPYFPEEDMDLKERKRVLYTSETTLWEIE
tara:strand:- start:533 stop:712 length:180 start_codon:yes stop_codon:yes gene_type:complete